MSNMIQNVSSGIELNITRKQTNKGKCCECTISVISLIFLALFKFHWILLNKIREMSSH